LSLLRPPPWRLAGGEGKSLKKTSPECVQGMGMPGADRSAPCLLALKRQKHLGSNILATDGILAACQLAADVLYLFCTYLTI